MSFSGNTGVSIMLLCQSHPLLEHTILSANDTSFYCLCRVVTADRQSVVINFEKLCEISSNTDRLHGFLRLHFLVFLHLYLLEIIVLQLTDCRCKTWLINCGRSDLDSEFQSDPLFPSRNCWLCSNHFEQNQFVGKKKNR